MPNEDSTQRTGSESSKEPEKPAEKKDGAPGETSPKVDPAEQPLTPAIMKGVLDAQLRSQRQETDRLLKESHSKLQAELENLKKTQETKPEGEGGKGQASEAEPAELVKLRQRVSELEADRSKALQETEKARKAEKDFRFKTMVQDALVRAKCRKPEQAYRIIAPDLRWNDESTGLFATVESEFGTRDLGVDEFIKEHVSENVIPELFEGKYRPGSAASGDDGSHDGRFAFTAEQINDVEFYQKHKEEIRKALEEGRVKMPQR
jgi:hypothetical protein